MTSPACNCHLPSGHRRDCPAWEAWDAGLRAAVERADEIRETRATGHRMFRSVHALLRWSYRYRESKRSAKALPLDPDLDSGTGTPNRAMDDPRMRLQASVLYAEKLACLDAKPLPLARWLVLAHAGQRPYWSLAESTGHSTDQVKRGMSRAHRMIAERLAPYIEGESDADE